MGLTERLINSLVAQCSVPTILLFLTTLAIIYVVKYVLYLRSLPPGPYGLPILGSLAKFKKAFHLQMFDFAMEYGKLMSVKMGSQLVVCINDVQTLKKIMCRGEFTARPKSALDSIVQGYGLITADGELWQSQRRFLHKHKFGLKSWGNVGEQMETRVNHEVLDCLNALAADCEDAPVNPSHYLCTSISNVICSIIMSTRFRHGEQRFKHFVDMFDEGFKLFKLTGSMIFLPFLKFLPALTATVEKLKENRATMLAFVGEIVDDHKKSLDVKEPRDLVDAYLMEIEKCKEEGTTEETFCSREPETQLKQILLDLFSAGFETVKSTLLWTLIHVLRNPEVKVRVQQELDRVLGSSRLPTLDDMSKLPYTRAVILESMRRTPAVPMGTTHSNTRPVLVEGHLVPANSHIVPNIYAIHMDPGTWDQPELFNPARFLSTSDNGEVQVVKPKAFVPFGVGQRMCLGDQLAQIELQLFFASILHVFDVDGVEGAELPGLEGELGATLTPDQFKLNLVPRNMEALIAANAKSKPTYFNHMRTYG